MCAELEPVRGAGRRWGFSLGCARVGRDPGARDTGLSPARRRRPPRRDRRRALGELGARGYDRQLLRDLPHSGAPDLATLGVSDALASTLTC
jgi:hypothetical protein